MFGAPFRRIGCFQFRIGTGPKILAVFLGDAHMVHDRFDAGIGGCVEGRTEEDARGPGPSVAGCRWGLGVGIACLGPLHVASCC